MEIPHDFLLLTPGNATFFNLPGEFLYAISSVPLEIPCPQPCCGYFLEKPIFYLFISYSFSVECKTLRCLNLSFVFKPLEKVISFIKGF